MKAKELVERLRTFSTALQDHRKLWGESLSDSWMADGIVRNHQAVLDHQRELIKMLAALNPYINQFILGRVIGGYGQTWDIFASSTTDDHPTRKARSLQEAIQQIDGVIARLEIENPEHDIPESPTPNPIAARAASAAVVDALQDQLVPLQNRRGLDAAFDQHSKDAGQPLCLVLFDLDHFKDVNDKHGGHATGDEALLSVAEIALACTRGKGQAFRIGGDEFVLLLPNHTLQEGLAVAERLRREINSTPRTTRQLTLSVSVGVAAMPLHGTDLDAIKKAADAALYDAKERHRNVVRYYGEQDPPPPAGREPERRVGESGGLSASEQQRIRQDFFRHHVARCPRDQAILDVQDTTGMGQATRSLYVSCPLCGLSAELD